MNRKRINSMIGGKALRTVLMVAAVLLGVVTAKADGDTPATSTGPTIHGNVYGGGNLADVGGSVTVNMSTGEVRGDVYGGGALANTNINNATNYGTALETVSSTSVNTTSVNLTGGTIKGDAYGGGLGRIGVEAKAAVEADPENGIEAQPAVAAVEEVKALVYGDVSVTLGNATSATAFNISHYDGAHADVVKSGRVFGCNNLNGCPLGDVTVTVNKTVAGNLTRTTAEYLKDDAATHSYEVAAVYGGGNLANYQATGKKASVIIKTCDVSIESVYGGGNAAAVPETDVLVEGAYEIGDVFGGGNGNDPYTLDGGSTWTDNAGANVNGNANTLLTGGYIHEAYGGSNRRGTITGVVSIDVGTGGACTLDVEKLVGAGKNADVDGDIIMVMGCKPSAKIPLLYAGADNANVNGNVELTITSGNFGRVFGGNNEGGIIKGHIKVNIEETGDCDTPINIDELYLGGNLAAYSVYGYKDDGDGNLIPRSSLTDGTLAYTEPASHPEGSLYEQPVLNIVSCTSIGQVFGGGYGATAAMYADPTVNINMIPGAHATEIDRDGDGSADDNANALGAVGDVFGGGNEADVYGNTTVNIGTATTVTLHASYNASTREYVTSTASVEGARITGNVYGGGNHADVKGNTFVNVCAVKTAVLDDNNVPTSEYTYNSVEISGESYEGVKILGSVYGGGNLGSVGTFSDSDFAAGGSTTCTANTGTASVTISGGTIGIDGHENGMVFGSSRGDVAAPDATGQDPNNKLAWVNETHVTIGISSASSNVTPAIKGSVYGGGENGHVLTDTHVAIHSGTIGIETGEAIDGLSGADYPSRGNVYGGGSGTTTYNVTTGTGTGAVTKTYFNRSAGIVRGNATVTMDGGHVVRNIYGGGAMGSVGKYTRDPKDSSEPEDDNVPGPIASCATNTGLCTVTITGGEVGPDDMQMPTNAGMVFGAGRGEVHDLANYPNLERVIYVNETELTIGGTAFIKGSVYGGSESGHVLGDTHVTIAGNCQIGNGWDPTLNSGDGGGINKRYTEYASYGTWPTETENITTSWAECSHWTMDTATGGVPYDKYAIYSQEETLGEGDAATTVTKYYYDSEYKQYAEGGSSVATDGHTFYGNVFGGGSGREPYAPGQWLRSAGQVGGSTTVDITGGHILTSAYGGNEMTDVTGSCTVNMVGGTLGVPRTEADARAHLVTCLLFGAGKGDPRTLFYGWTNVASTAVNVSGDARIYGSTFGGGEDGHVLGNAVTNIGGSVTIDGTTYTQPATTSAEHPGVIIGTTGTSTGDGNVFGGGRGYLQTALTAGVVRGNVTVNYLGGKMLANIYGGGRLASVGTYLAEESNTAQYGALYTTETANHGNIAVNVSGGTIKGSVFGGSMGVVGSEAILRKFGKSRATEVNVTGGAILGSVYGGNHSGGAVESTATLNITGGMLGSQANINESQKASVFGGGYGEDTAVFGNVNVNIGSTSEESQNIDLSPRIYGDVYGGSAQGDVNGGKHLGATYADQYKNPSTTQVNLFGGIVYGDAYGGGLGTTTIPANVYGPVTVTLNGTAFDATNHPTKTNTADASSIPISGRVFGCNNINGSPKSTVLVHVKRTVGVTRDDNSLVTATTNTKTTGTYDMEAVYGGGNMAAYEPDASNMTATGQYATTNHDATNNPLQVVVDGCTTASIEYVYGGGNAASTPSTDVLVLGAYEIGNVFGGGNGKDDIPQDSENTNGTYITNPGANVGYLAYTDDSEKTSKAYGTGKTHATVNGGTVHALYGGSNTKGNIRVEARATLEDLEACPFNVGEAYGGGHNAPQDGDAVLEIGCISGLGKAYGGAANADVNGDVVLNITNGTYGQVFGGNDEGGCIRGSITVNIEETGCRPIIIGELYAGGNEAAYSVYGYNADGSVKETGDNPVADPVVNVRSFTSIGTIYGGGYGSTATMVASPEVNINVYEGKYCNTFNGSDNVVNDNARVVGSAVAYSGTGYDSGFPIPSHAKGKIGAIGTVFGGGNAAKVIGNPTVNIGTEAGDEVYAEVAVATDDDVKGLYTRSGEGTTASPYTYTEITTPTADTSTTYYKKTVKAVDIRGNVFGGGNNAEVTGDTNVVIGAKKTE